VATDSPYWNPKTETLDRERIEALQLAKLRRQCEWAAARSPWYRRRFASEGIDPEQLRSRADLRRIPVLTREDWTSSPVIADYWLPKNSSRPIRASILRYFHRVAPEPSVVARNRLQTPATASRSGASARM